MKLILLISSIAKRFSRDDMTNHASSVSFWLLISAIPFLMLIITVISLVPGLDRESVTQIIYSALPDMQLLHELVDSVLSNIYVDNSGTLISLSAILTLWSASSGVYRLETAIKKACGSSHHMGYLRRRAASLVYTIFFILALVLSLALVVLGSALGSMLIAHFPLLDGPVGFLMDFNTLISGAFIFIFMTAIYRFMPSGLEDELPVLPGSLFASVSWTLASYGFSFYFTYLKNISYMYGSLGALTLLMFWLFLIICIILLGAEINATFYLYDLRSFKKLKAFLR